MEKSRTPTCQLAPSTKNDIIQSRILIETPANVNTVDHIIKTLGCNIQEHITPHSLRRGFAESVAGLKSLEIPNIQAARRALNHSHQAYVAGTTEKYIGQGQQSFWDLIVKKDHDLTLPNIATSSDSPDNTEAPKTPPLPSHSHSQSPSPHPHPTRTHHAPPNHPPHSNSLKSKSRTMRNKVEPPVRQDTSDEENNSSDDSLDDLDDTELTEYEELQLEEITANISKEEEELNGGEDEDHDEEVNNNGSDPFIVVNSDCEDGDHEANQNSNTSSLYSVIKKVSDNNLVQHYINTSLPTFIGFLSQINTVYKDRLARLNNEDELARILKLNAPTGNSRDPPSRHQFDCSECGYTVCRRDTFGRHKCKERNISKPFKCATCGNSFKTRQTLSQHVSRQHAPTECVCQNCDPVKLLPLKEYRTHVLDVHANFTFNCSYKHCKPHGFKTIEALKRHLQDKKLSEGAIKKVIDPLKKKADEQVAKYKKTILPPPPEDE